MAAAATTEGTHGLQSQLLTGLSAVRLRTCVHAAWALLSGLLLLVVAAGQQEEDLGEEGGWGMPGYQQDFRFEVPAGSGQCFFQFVKEGHHIHVSFDVVRGADRNIDVVLHAPSGQIIEQKLWVQEGELETRVLHSGDYRVCIDNSFSRFTSKVVYLYLVTWGEDEWAKHAEELAQFSVSVDNVTNSLQVIDKSIIEARKHILVSKFHAAGDEYLAMDNNYYVQNLSILMCCVIVATSGFQVFFVRRLFHTHKVTPTAKPRA